MTKGTGGGFGELGGVRFAFELERGGRRVKGDKDVKTFW